MKATQVLRTIPAVSLCFLVLPGISPAQADPAAPIAQLPTLQQATSDASVWKLGDSTWIKNDWGWWEPSNISYEFAEVQAEGRGPGRGEVGVVLVRRIGPSDAAFLTIDRDVICSAFPGYRCAYQLPSSMKAVPQRNSSRQLLEDQAYWKLRQFAAEVCQRRQAEWIHLQYVTYEGETDFSLSGTLFDCSEDSAPALAAAMPTKATFDEDYNYWVLRVRNGVTSVPVKYSGSGSPSYYECRLTGVAYRVWQCGTVRASAPIRGAGKMVFEVHNGQLRRLQLLR